MAQTLLRDRKGRAGGMDAGVGISIGLGAIFVLGIGLAVVTSVIDDGNYSGTTALVLGFTGLIVAAGFIFWVAKQFGMIRK